ncbi:MAG: hypothetical protein WC205_15995 [Opitutaceae bacterium]|jgi:hypothetical protein
MLPRAQLAAAPTSRSLHALRALAVFVLLSVQADCAESRTDLAVTHTLPRVTLRGFGELSAVFWQNPARDASLLVVTCENEARARLTHAKYLSDLAILPGLESVRLSAVEPVIHAWRRSGDGALFAAAWRERRVVILAAANEERLRGLLAAGAPGLRSDDFAPGDEVPMWLDRWDKFGFRFYYRAWELPPGARSFADYDFARDFDFAEQSGRTGLVFWANAEEMDSAEGMTNEPWWRWAFDEAAARRLPVGFNLNVDAIGQGWFFNRHRDQTSLKAPQFSGSTHKIANPYFNGSGLLSWSATGARDEVLGLLQGALRRVADTPGLVSILEPHGELRHGQHDILLDYGPVADAGLRRFLRRRYAAPADWVEAWGLPRSFTWADVRAPEPASFVGWGPKALDLAGVWKVGYEPLDREPEPDYQGGRSNDPVPSRGAREEWFAEKHDDRDWPEVVAPGHDRTMFLPSRPAVYRREFDVTSAWHSSRTRVWLYVWDLNTATGDTLRVALNGRMVGEDRLRHATPHWGAYEVTGILRAGKNQLSIRLPKGVLAYRVYLSPEPPRQYPGLGRAGNARWVDFSDWIADSRADAVRRGLEMIRQVDTVRPIVLMAPEGFEDGVRRLAKDYGGAFHNTGYMSAFWADPLPALMRGSRLPFSLEPGEPARTLPEFKQQIGLYSTSGVQGVDYFIHIGDVLWRPELRRHFEEQLPLLKLLGKYHAPDAEVAALYATRNERLRSFPWTRDSNSNAGSGYWSCDPRGVLRGLHESDALTESSFAEGDAGRYRVVIDSNTSILDARLLAEIERYVRAGGVFVTLGQTGRHDPLSPDSWPISRLSGFAVEGIDSLESDGSPTRVRALRSAPGQDVFPADWAGFRGHGLSLRACESDAMPLLLWEDGSVAAGARKLGSGYLIQLGCRPDHAELRRLLARLLAWRKIPRAAGAFTPENSGVILRHYLSNNGLFDVWALWNERSDASVTGELRLDEAGARIDAAWDVGRGVELDVAEARLPLTLAPLETRVFLTPRAAPTTAPLNWLELQRDWWRRSVTASPVPLPAPAHRYSVDLSTGWSHDGAVGAKGAVVDLGVWKTPGAVPGGRETLHRSFTVPAHWPEGDVTLSFMAWSPPTFIGRGRVSLDSAPLTGWGTDGIMHANPSGVLRPGSTHILALELESAGRWTGTRGTAWLWLWAKPEAALDLAGEWRASKDALRYDQSIRLPGPYATRMFRRRVLVPEEQRGRNVMLEVEATGTLTGVLVNGTWLRRLHHHIGTRFDLNITPWIKFGEENEIELVCMQGAGSGEVRFVRLGFHRPELYP